MNSKKFIKRKLNESAPNQVKRRIDLFDDSFKHYRDAFSKYSYRNFNIYWNNVMERISETLYHAWFVNTVSEDEWDESEKFIQDYIKEKFYDDTKKWWENKNRNKINESEENKLDPMILRRVNYETLNNEFKECLEDATNMYFKRQKGGMSFTQFRNLVLSFLIDSIHYDIHSSMPEESEWYDDVFYMLKNHYEDEIKKQYNKININSIRESITPTYILRRIQTVEDYINNLNPNDICVYWADDESHEYVRQIMLDITRIILDENVDTNSENYSDMFDDVYDQLIKFNYDVNIRSFFFKSLKNCGHRSRLKFQVIQENVPHQIKRRIHFIDKVINNMLPNMYPCDYNSSDHFVEGVLDEIRWFLIDVEELKGIERMDIENYILDYKYDELTNYFNRRCIVLKNDNLQESTRRILKEELTKEVKWLLRRLNDPDLMDDLDTTVKSTTMFATACGMTEDNFFDEVIENSVHNFINHWEELYETDDFLPLDDLVYHLIYKNYKDYILSKYESKMMRCD